MLCPHLFYAKPNSQHLSTVIHYLLIQTALRGAHHHFCFVGGDTEAKRG